MFALMLMRFKKRCNGGGEGGRGRAPMLMLMQPALVFLHHHFNLPSLPLWFGLATSALALAFHLLLLYVFPRLPARYIVIITALFPWTLYQPDDVFFV